MTEQESHKVNIPLDENEMAQTRTSLSFERTDLAVERTRLANSQTFLSYTRTAITVFAAGIGMFEFVNNDNFIHIGMVLMGISPIIAGVGVIHYFRVRHRINSMLND